MERRKRWQLWVILLVAFLTLYNILPTIFYYSQPLREPIGAEQAMKVAHQVADRVNGLADDSKAWLSSYSDLLGLQLESVELDARDPRLFKLTFGSPQEAAQMARFLPSAANLIPFIPAQFSLAGEQLKQRPNELYLVRNVGVQFDPSQLEQFFRFSEKMGDNGLPTPLWKEVVYDRTSVFGMALAGPSRLASQMAALLENRGDPTYDEMTIALAKEVASTSRQLAASPSLLHRWSRHLVQGRSPLTGEKLVQATAPLMESLKARLSAKKELLAKEIEEQLAVGGFRSGEQQETLLLLNKQIQALAEALAFFDSQSSWFAKSPSSMTPSQFAKALSQSESKLEASDPEQWIDLQGRHPFIEALVIDWNNDQLRLRLFDDVAALRDQPVQSEARALLRDKVNQLLFNDLARAASLSDEQVTADGSDYLVRLNALDESRSFLALDLGRIAQLKSEQLLEELRSHWSPSSRDFASELYPRYEYQAWSQLPAASQRLGLVVYAPAALEELPLEGLSGNAIYVILRGYESIAQKYREMAQAEEALLFKKDFEQLSRQLQQYGFVGFEGSSLGVDPLFKNDYLFRLDDYYNNLISATREQFTVKGTKRYAVLDFTDVEQRIMARNRIWDQQQEDLLKWKEEYDSAQVSLDKSKRYEIPPPSKNVYWENFKTSFAKYFLGDDRKVLKWGLDLSGGKTVRIGLRDANNKPVTRPEDLQQAVNELYTRVNKMGVSERTIRIENADIVLEFPGSRAVSASDLIKASAMYFHIVNEKFTPYSPTIGAAVDSFLQEVWNEAVVTNRKNVHSINEIARKQLGQDVEEEFAVQPRSEQAKMLWEAGLRLASLDSEASSSFDDTLSKIGLLRGNDSSQWHRQNHPLVVLFNNYALDGSSLTNVNVGWDQNEGNILNFQVKSSYEGSRIGNPRDDFYNWTSQFSEERVAGTSKEVYSQGRGWRMAVELNGEVVTMPNLRAALRDGGSISGRFSQREINQLAADLKAGSLSFTPRILSEQNVSPELGKEERVHGILASAIALLLVFVAMISYYRFGGLVASCALIFNILIMWAVLQNLDAALTLPGIAGIVLTIGMAVDANVLVFERVREEFKISKRIGSAIQAGYRKAFSAIIDSNVTTIIAALILIQFDAGPIKAFAVTLIIGIVSSMFTALFLTRYFFAGWVQNPRNKELKMAELIQNTKIDFLGFSRTAIIASVLFIAAGGLLFVGQYRTIFGMDFTGGYSLTVDVQEKVGEADFNYRLAALDGFLAMGATSNDVHVRQLSYPWQLRIQLATGMEEKGHPFYQLPQEIDGNFAYPYQANPRLTWIVDSLTQAGLTVSDSQLQQLERHWTAMSGQLSDSMRNNAVMALLLALGAILVYITLRFEFKYAISAVIALAHDLLITIGLVALFHKMGIAIQIDLQAIGAIMTIIGYSLNDTIIVFDRIREDLRLLRKLSYSEVVNHAINVTLARTLMTSGTTLLVLLTLVLLGGESIFGFALVMTVGVLVGTLSSLFVAPAALLYFHNREELVAAPGKASY